MSLLDLTDYDLDNAEEPKAVKAGEEYKLRILSVENGTDKNGLDYYMPRFEIVEHPASKDFTYFLHVPDKDKMNEKQLTRARWAMKNFLQCFGLSTGPTNPDDDWPGQEGWAILGMREDEQYGEQNFVKKFVIPR